MGTLIFLSVHSIFTVTYSTIIAENERRTGDEAKLLSCTKRSRTSLMIESLNQSRNKLIADGKYTDAIDEVMLKIIGAKRKKFKVIFKKA